MSLKHRWRLLKQGFCALMKTGIFLVLMFILLRYVILCGNVVSGSMEPTLMTGERIIGNRLAYHLRQPRRGDVITFIAPDDPKRLFVKRIVGLPGDTIYVVGGRVFINEDPTNYIPVERRVTLRGDGVWLVPDASYFVMGDQSSQSDDSRFWSQPFVEDSQITSYVLFAWGVQPFRRIG